MAKKDKKIIKLDPEDVKAITDSYDNRPSIFESNKDNSLKTTSVKNVVIILQRDQYLKDLFKFNEFTNEVDVVKDCTIKTDLGNIVFKKGQYTDQVIYNVELYIESNSMYEHAIFKNNVIDQGIINFAHMHSYNPIIDYMNEAYLNWDEKRRLDNFFPTFLGVEKNETSILITRLWFMGGVAKAYDPTTKFDFVLDLVGSQGVGKTTLLQKIAPLGLYTDQFNSFTETDDLKSMLEAFIVNDDEMTASKKATFGEIKKFSSLKEIKYRLPYARKNEKNDIHFIVARTTNNLTYLKDKSGERRYLPLLADIDKQKKHPVTDLTPEYVKQLWGEAVWLLKNAKDPFQLTDRQEGLLNQARLNFNYTTGLEDTLMDALENNFKDKDFITNEELGISVLCDQDAFKRNTKETKAVRIYMEQSGYKVGAKKRINGNQVRGFQKLK